MRLPFSWMNRLFGGERSNVLALLTPEAARNQNVALRFALAGGTALGLGVAALIGVVAMAALMFAVAAIYFLSTQVLGLKIDVDPKAFYEQVQRQAQTAYGPN